MTFAKLQGGKLAFAAIVTLTTAQQLWRGLAPIYFHTKTPRLAISSSAKNVGCRSTISWRFAFSFYIFAPLREIFLCMK
jgi:hypothetical protein